MFFFEKEQENDDNPLYILVDGNIEESLADKTSGKSQAIRQIAVIFRLPLFYFVYLFFFLVKRNFWLVFILLRRETSHKFH